MKPKTRFVTPLAFACLSLATNVRAADGTWAGATDFPSGPTKYGALWSTSTNWTSNVIAGSVGTTTSTDTLTFNNGGHYTIDLDANYNVKFINSSIHSHTHYITSQNGSILSLTSGGAITSTGTGNGNNGYAAAMRLEGGSGGSYTFNVNSGNMIINNTVSGTAAAGGDYTLELGGSGAGTVGTSSPYVGKLSDGTGGGTLSVLKTGTGTWTLNNASTYTGTTTIQNGKVRILNAGSLGTGTSSIILGGSGTGASDNLELEWSNNITMARNIVVNNNNSSGTTTISVRNNLGSPTLSGTLTLNRNVTIHDSGSGFLTVTGVISGTGGIIKVGADRATLSAANTFQGDTRMTAGSLRLNNVNALQNSTLDLTGTGTVSFFVTGSNTYNLGGLKGGTGLVIDGNTISVGANSQNTAYSGAISNSTGSGKVTKVGTGTLTLSGTNTYTGATTVSAGTLFVTGSLTSNVTVSDNATLGGGGATTGTISFESASMFDIFAAIGLNPLDASSISFTGSGFGIDNLVSNGAAVNWGTVNNGTYTLINGTLNSTNLDNFGLANAYGIGDGRTAYFQSGSLELVVIPEPNVAALLGGLGMILLLRRRRG